MNFEIEESPLGNNFWWFDDLRHAKKRFLSFFLIVSFGEGNQKVRGMGNSVAGVRRGNVFDPQWFAEG